MPVDNGFIESFNVRLRDECFNASVFTSPADARPKIEARRVDYNEQRPHSSPRDRTPNEMLRQAKFVKSSARTHVPK